MALGTHTIITCARGVGALPTIFDNFLLLRYIDPARTLYKQLLYGNRAYVNRGTHTNQINIIS
jgi:hypothetical protein